MVSLLLRVTILILIDGFLQYDYLKGKKTIIESHNPYFNRWFSAINTRAEYAELYPMSQSLF